MRLRVVSYNVHKGVGTDGRTDIPRLADVLLHYEADVICLQEVMWYEPWRGKRSHAEQLGDLLPHEHVAVGLNCRRHFGIYGNVTFSARPFAAHANVDLTVPLKRPRSALFTRVAGAAGGPPLDVYNAHLGLARFERSLQSERLVAEVEETSPGRTPTIVLGDTNDWRDRLFGAVFRPAGFERHEPRRRGPTHGTFPSWYPVADLDKVFVRGDLRLVRVFPSRLALARVASDHLPVVADVELSEDAGDA